MPEPAQPGHSLRAVRRDVERNYHRVLDAAREVFGESGADASIEEIAARAGVGIGTGPAVHSSVTATSRR